MQLNAEAKTPIKKQGTVGGRVAGTRLGSCGRGTGCGGSGSADLAGPGHLASPSGGQPRGGPEGWPFSVLTTQELVNRSPLFLNGK